MITPISDAVNKLTRLGVAEADSAEATRIVETACARVFMIGLIKGYRDCLKDTYDVITEMIMSAR